MRLPDRRTDLLAGFGGALDSLRITCGKPSYAQLRRTSAALPPATVSDVLRGKSNPRVEFVLAFVAACRDHAAFLGLDEPREEASPAVWQQRWRDLQLSLRADVQAGGPEPDDGRAEMVLDRATHELGPNEDVEAAERLLLLASRSPQRLARVLRTLVMVHLHHLLGEPAEARRLAADLDRAHPSMDRSPESEPED